MKPLPVSCEPHGVSESRRPMPGPISSARLYSVTNAVYSSRPRILARFNLTMADSDIAHRVKREWAKFLRWTSTRNTVNWMFRGQSNTDWPLIPKIGRSESHRERYNINSEWTMLDTFRKSAIAHLHGTHLPSSSLQWMVLAQHHGLPTRLLDWTKSPFIAAYFALQNEDPRSDAAVYAIDVRWQLLFDTDQIDPFAIPVVSKISPSIVSDRIIAQRGIFTIHPQPDMPLTPPTGKRFSKYIFPRDLKKEIKTKLVNIGINWHTLFLNLDGLADHITFMNRIYAPRYNQYDWSAIFESTLKEYNDHPELIVTLDQKIKEHRTIGDAYGENFYKKIRARLMKK